jgi:hydrogenase maturation factor
VGKIPIRILNQTVLKMVGARSERIVTPAEAGVDFAAVKAGRGYIVVSADPVTGVSKDIGRYALLVSANDVATSGHGAQFAESVILLPEGSGADDVVQIAKQIHEAAKGSGIAIVGGHTEVTPGLRRPIVVITAFSYVNDFVTSAEAREGDCMMMTKTAGIEGTAVISGSRRILGELSVAREAVAAYQTGVVHAMHDCTEGGVIGAAFEMSLASGLGFELRENSVPVSPKTARICTRSGIDPLKLIGSGALLLAVERGKEAEVEEALLSICAVSRIGWFTKKGRRLVRRDGRKEPVREAPVDELWRVISRLPGSGHGS